MASGQGSLRHTDNPTDIIYVYSAILVILDVVFKHTTLPTAQAQAELGPWQYVNGAKEYFV